MKKDNRFNYCIASFWSKTGNSLCSYTYGNEVHYGTLSDAMELKKYIESKNPADKWFVFKLVKIEN